MLLLLFVPDELTLVETESGTQAAAAAAGDPSKRAGHAYLGYLRGQKERLLGTRGQKRVNRPELVEAHGLDTKYAMHARRLGYQGVEVLEAGLVTLPMPEPERSRVMAVRRGERSFDEVLAEIDEVEQRLDAVLDQTALPDSPDDDAVSAFLRSGGSPPTRPWPRSASARRSSCARSPSSSRSSA